MADPLHGPALEPPSGVISQFPTVHSDEQAWFYAAATLSAVVPGTLLFLRLYTKLRVVRKVDLTDYLATLSFLFLVAEIICARLGLGEGAGVHQWNLPMHNFIKVNYWLYVAQILYAPTHFLAKTAILLQYLRLFAPQRTVDPFMWYSTRIVIMVTGTFYGLSAFLTIFACSPPEASWNLLIIDERCTDNNMVVLIICLFNIVSDIVILILPGRAVWRLRIPTKSKLKIVLLFAIGLLACIATVMMIIYLARMGEENSDVSYNALWLALWALAEISLGISVTGTFLLPKFIEAKGTKLRNIFSNLIRPFTSLTSGTSFETVIQSKKDTVGSQELTLDPIIIRHSDSILVPTNGDQDVERYPNHKGHS